VICAVDVITSVTRRPDQDAVIPVIVVVPVTVMTSPPSGSVVVAADATVGTVAAPTRMPANEFRRPMRVSVTPVPCSIARFGVPRFE
jgi:hypothetical protein